MTVRPDEDRNFAEWLWQPRRKARHAPGRDRLSTDAEGSENLEAAKA
jgi:hypothetical protein